MADHNCEYLLELTDEENESIYWLNELLRVIIEKGPGSPAYEKAVTLAETMLKIRDYCNNMHDIAHALEVDAIQIDRAINQLITLPKAQA